MARFFYRCAHGRFLLRAGFRFRVLQCAQIDLSLSFAFRVCLLLLFAASGLWCDMAYHFARYAGHARKSTVTTNRKMMADRRLYN